MESPELRVTPKGAFYRIQDPITGLYARIHGDAPSSPQPSEESHGAVTARHAHVRFVPWELSTWFRTHEQAMTAFARYIGVAALEIVRCEP